MNPQALLLAALIGGAALWLISRKSSGGGNSIVITTTAGVPVTQLLPQVIYEVRVTVTNPSSGYTTMALQLSGTGPAASLNTSSGHNFAPGETYTFIMALGIPSGASGTGIITATVTDTVGNLIVSLAKGIQV